MAYRAGNITEDQCRTANKVVAGCLRVALGHDMSECTADSIYRANFLTEYEQQGEDNHCGSSGHKRELRTRSDSGEYVCEDGIRLMHGICLLQNCNKGMVYTSNKQL